MHVTDKAYQDHPVFSELQYYIGFYKQLAFSVFQFPTMGAKAIFSLDSYLYSSMQGTVESMRAILLTGRINDTYALLRKYHDSAVINVYSNLYLRDNFSIDNFIVQKISNWHQGKEKLPRYGVMSRYIKSSESLKPINDIFQSDDRYKLLRDRCNDHSHYNLYCYALLNDNEIYIDNPNRSWWLDRISEDARDIFVLHLGYILFLNSHYMMSSDYLDALECGIQPEEGSQYLVARFIQEVFDDVITPNRPDLTSTIKMNSAMQLS